MLEVLFWSLIGSIFSLAGGLLLIYKKSIRQVAVRFGLPFGAGTLLAAAFLGVLPEAVEGADIHTVAVYALGGFLGFFVLERLLGWFHHHEDHHHELEHHARSDKSHQWLVVIGDTLHNAIDGVAIGAAFLVNPAAGIGTAIAVAAHELPQEIGDFSILLAKGMKPWHVVMVNVASALATVLMAVLTFSVGESYGIDAAPLLAVAAGFFIYIAASDIIPDIHEKPRKEGNVQAAMLLLGVAVLATIMQFTPHTHEHGAQDGRSHGTRQHDDSEAH